MNDDGAGAAHLVVDGQRWRVALLSPAFPGDLPGRVLFTNQVTWEHRIIETPLADGRVPGPMPIDITMALFERALPVAGPAVDPLGGWSRDPRVVPDL